MLKTGEQRLTLEFENHVCSFSIVILARILGSLTFFLSLIVGKVKAEMEVGTDF